MLNCPYAKKCSGCQLQNLTYPKQLDFKTATCIRLLGKFCHVESTVGAENPYHYRNKAQTVIFKRNGYLQKGLYHSAENKVLPIENCLLEHENVANITDSVLKLLKGFKIKPYSLSDGSGLLRHILVRQNKKGNEWMVVLVTANADFKHKVSFANELVRRHPEITSVVWNINPTDTPLFLGEKEEILFGTGSVTDTLCGLTFKISPRSFYQVNPAQTEVLYSLVKKLADLQGNETVLDAYCGTGTIGLTLADQAKQIIGVEINADAVRDARQNADANHIENAVFIEGDAGKFIANAAKEGKSFDVCITDPPRAGCSQKFLQSLLTLAPEKIVYVSCNPETLSRDLAFLTRGGYKVKKIIPVDLFPHTRHCEVVCKLVRRTISKQ